MSGKKWEVIKKFKIENLKLKIDEIVHILLKSRGIRTKAQEKEFFNPTHPDKLKPDDFDISAKELKKAISRIKRAKKSGERVIVWGDYDADGICGAAILWEALYYNGVNALPFIPERRTEGYGLNIERMKSLKEEDSSVGLIITVDNGIVAHKKVDTAKELGLDVIITDHHLPRKTKPKAYAILHTTKISGAGVAWILARELAFQGVALEDHLGLVALATVADMVPLVGVARSLVFHGLAVLQKSKRPGIIALSRIAKINQEEIGTYEVGFILAPRFNAMGRLEHAMESLRLLCTKSLMKAHDLALRLNETNINRQKMVSDIIIHAREQVILNNSNELIFIADETYHEGVVGLVASRLVEEFGKPAIVVSKGKNLSKGSARSVSGFNIVQLIELGSEFLIDGGGHPMAAGFTVKTEHIALFTERLVKHANSSLTKEHLIPKIRVDCELSIANVTLELAKKLEYFAPFGVGNPDPVFVSRGVQVADIRLVGNENKHLKLRIMNNESRIMVDAIAFNMGELYSQLLPERSIDIVYTVDIDNWNGGEKLQLKIKDINPNP